jgi:hypothetical protein
MSLCLRPEDADFAALLAGRLSQDEFRTSRITLVHAWRTREEVDIAIREALAVVAILSPVSAIALVNYGGLSPGFQVPVLPVLLEIAEADLHPRLRTLQYLDFRNPGDRPWHLLMQALHKLESAQRPTTVHVPRDAPPVIQQAARALDGTNKEERAAALASLSQMNHPAVVEVLAEALRHPARQVRFGSAIHLAAHRDCRRFRLCSMAFVGFLKLNRGCSAISDRPLSRRCLMPWAMKTSVVQGRRLPVGAHRRP